MKQIPLPDQINQRPVLKFSQIRNTRRVLEDRGFINERGPRTLPRCYRCPIHTSGRRKQQNTVEVEHATNGRIYWHIDRVVAALLIYVIERGSLRG